MLCAHSWKVNAMLYLLGSGPTFWCELELAGLLFKKWTPSKEIINIPAQSWNHSIPFLYPSWDVSDLHQICILVLYCDSTFTVKENKIKNIYYFCPQTEYIQLTLTRKVSLFHDSTCCFLSSSVAAVLTTSILTCTHIKIYAAKNLLKTCHINNSCNTSEESNSKNPAFLCGYRWLMKTGAHHPCSRQRVCVCISPYLCVYFVLSGFSFASLLALLQLVSTGLFIGLENCVIFTPSDHSLISQYWQSM